MSLKTLLIGLPLERRQRQLLERQAEVAAVRQSIERARRAAHDLDMLMAKLRGERWRRYFEGC